MTSEEFKEKFDKIVKGHRYYPHNAEKEDIRWLILDLEELLKEVEDDPLE